MVYNVSVRPRSTFFAPYEGEWDMQKSNKGLMTVHFIVMLAGLVLCVMGLVGEVPTMIFKWILLLSIFALIFGFVYFLKGYGKQAAVFYMVFMALFAVISLLTVIAASRKGLPLSVVTEIIVFAVIVVLAVRENTGKKISLLLTSVMMAAQVVHMVYTIVVHTSAAAVYMAIVLAILAATAGLMVLAKYRDKDARGTV